MTFDVSATSPAQGPKETRGRVPWRVGLMIVLVAAIGLSWWHVGAREAHAQPVKPVLEAVVHLKAVNYDRALQKRSGAPVVISILYQSEKSKSMSRADDMNAAFRALSKKMKLQGRRFSAFTMPYEPGKLASTLNAKEVDAVYIAPGFDTAEIDAIRTVVVKSQRPTMCGERELVKRGKVALGVFLRDDRPGLAVHLQAAREVGMDMDATLFSVAEVFK